MLRSCVTSGKIEAFGGYHLALIEAFFRVFGNCRIPEISITFCHSPDWFPSTGRFATVTYQIVDLLLSNNTILHILGAKAKLFHR